MGFPNDERGEIANLGEGLEGCANEAVFGVAIEENLEFISGGGAFGDGVTGQEDFAQFAPIEIQTGAGVLQDGQAIEFSKDGHFQNLIRREEDWR